MLTFYYHPLSPISRRVWLALLEKKIPFEPKLVNLNGEQYQADFLSLNPFHHIPVVVDGSFRILESLAILDYLEAQYPRPSLLSPDPESLARMRMVQMITTNELTPKLPALVMASDASQPDRGALQQIATALDFLSEQLDPQDYFGGDQLSLADITLGATLPLLLRLGVSLQHHLAMARWSERLQSRSAWQQTEPDEEAFNTWKRWVLLMIRRRQRPTVQAVYTRR